MKLLGRYAYYLLVLAAAVAAAWGWHTWHVDPPLVGTVETKVHRVGFREGGRIVEFAVEGGSAVRAGDPIARLDDADLVAERRRLEAELAYVEDLMDADRHRHGMEYSRLQLQLATDEHWLAQQYATVQERLAELNALNTEIERLRQAEDAGLGRARDLGELVVQRDAAARYVTERTKEVAKLRGAAGPQAAGKDDDVMASMLGDRMERVHELLHALVLLEQRRAFRTVVAPCDGPVVEVLQRAGDTVGPYAPVVAIEDASVAYAVVYVPETQDLRVGIGDEVRVHSRRARSFDTEGEVTFIHPGYSPIPPRFALRGQVAWARKLRVRLKRDHRLVPGELLRVNVGRDTPDGGLARTAHAAPVRLDEVVRPRPLDVPPSLAARSRFEPSGLVWLEDLERYLVVSDDTGHKGRNDHAPWVFLVDDEGRVEPVPLPLAGIDTVNDLEAVTVREDGRLLLMSSNNISKKGNRPRSRQRLLEVGREGRTLTVQRRTRLLPALLETHDPPDLATLGLAAREEDGLPVINVEGMAWHDGALYLGLKQPVGPAGALIWRLTGVDRLLETGRLEKGQVTVWGRVPLTTTDGRARGLSDLGFDAKGHLLVLSTVPGAQDDVQEGGLHRLVRSEEGRWEAHTLATFPGRKPEGLCVVGPKRLTLVFDADAATPAWADVDL